MVWPEVLGVALVSANPVVPVKPESVSCCNLGEVCHLHVNAASVEGCEKLLMVRQLVLYTPIVDVLIC